MQVTVDSDGVYVRDEISCTFFAAEHYEYDITHHEIDTFIKIIRTEDGKVVYEGSIACQIS